MAAELHRIAAQVGRLQQECQRYFEHLRHLTGCRVKLRLGRDLRDDRGDAKAADGLEAVQVTQRRDHGAIEPDFLFALAQGRVQCVAVGGMKAIATVANAVVAVVDARAAVPAGRRQVVAIPAAMPAHKGFEA